MSAGDPLCALHGFGPCGCRFTMLPGCPPPECVGCLAKDIEIRRLKEELVTMRVAKALTEGATCACCGLAPEDCECDLIVVDDSDRTVGYQAEALVCRAHDRRIG